jgi:taurine dioxygenase
MKIKPLANCGVEILDVDISKMTNDDYAEIKELFLEHLVVVLRNQPLKFVPYAKLIEGIGKIANWNQCIWDPNGDVNKYYTGSYVDPYTFTDDDSLFPIQRVTGKLKNGNITGIFGTGILDWHSNMNGPFNRARGVALQGVSQGCVGTSTSWMDTTKAYAAMSDELKKRCEGVEGRFEYSPEIWAEGLSKIQYEHMLKNKEEFYMMPLVNISHKGKPGLYFHFMNKCSFPSDPELLEILKEHCFKTEFIYKHVWEIGDIVLSDQVLTLHKRDQDDPAILAERILHRYTFNFDPK